MTKQRSEPPFPNLLTLRTWIAETKQCAALQDKTEIVAILDAVLGMVESEQRAIKAYISHQEDEYLELSEMNVDLIRTWHGQPLELNKETWQ